MNIQQHNQPFIIRRYNLGILEVFSLGHTINQAHPSIVLLKLLSMNHSFLIFSMLPFARLEKDTESLLRNINGRVNLKIVALLSDQIKFEHSFLNVVSTSEQAAGLLQRMMTLKKTEAAFLGASPFRSSVSYLFGIIEAPDIDLDRVERCVLKEPLLVSRIFQTVNSASNLRLNRIELLGQALAYLGLEGIKQVIALLIFTNVSENFSGSKKDITKHSNCCAYIAEKLALRRTKDSALIGKIRVAALLHDIGSMAFEYCFPDEYETIAVNSTLSQDGRQLEKNFFGIDHCELGFALGESWHLPKYILDTIQWHHNPIFWGDDIVVESVAMANLFLNKEIEKKSTPDYPLAVIRKYILTPELSDDDARMEILALLQSLWFKFDLQREP